MRKSRVYHKTQHIMYIVTFCYRSNLKCEYDFIFSLHKIIITEQLLILHLIRSNATKYESRNYDEKSSIIVQWLAFDVLECVNLSNEFIT